MQLKKKVEMLKNTRDYSFLLTDDAEVPASSKSPPLRNVLTPKSGVRLLLFWFVIVNAHCNYIFIKGTYTGFLVDLKMPDLLNFSQEADRW